MDHADKKSGEGLAHPSAASHTAPANAPTVAPAAASGFDDHTAQNALQQPQAAASTLPLIPVAIGAPAHAQHAAAGLQVGENLRARVLNVSSASRKRPWEHLYECMKDMNLPPAVPLRKQIHAEEFPLTALPITLQAAIDEVEYATQAPTALIAASALTAISVACQSLVSVERDEGLRGPASLYFLTIAASGERKTTVDKFFSKAITEWEREQAEAAKPLIAEYRAAEGNWIATGEGIRAAIKKAAANLSPDHNAAQALIQHEANKPVEPRVPSVLRMDDTPEALAAALMRWPVAAIMSSEAGIIFGAHGMNPESVMRNMGQLNIFWDGGHLKRDRTTTKSIDVEGMRVTVGLQVQPATLETFMDKQGTLARGTGFLARFLVSHPESTQGTRYYREPKPGYPALEKFNARCKALLNMAANVDADGKLTTTYLTLTPEAKSVWIGFHDSVEEELRSSGDYEDIQDVASKAADNAARLAACLHVFCEPKDGSCIGAESMRAATAVIRWYLEEARRFACETALPQVVRDAEKLEKWIVEKSKEGTVLVKTGSMSQIAPVREKLRRDAALDLLEEHHRIFRVNVKQRKEVCLTADVLWEYR